MVQTELSVVSSDKQRENGIAVLSLKKAGKTTESQGKSGGGALWTT